MTPEELAKRQKLIKIGSRVKTLILIHGAYKVGTVKSEASASDWVVDFGDETMTIPKSKVVPNSVISTNSVVTNAIKALERL